MDSGGALAKEMRDGQAAQLAAAYRSTAYKHAQNATLLAPALVLFFLILAFVSLATFAEENAR
jgi:hypothetical protein